MTRSGPTVAEMASLVGHLVVFEVETPGSESGDLCQVPVLLVQEIRRSKGGHDLIVGMNMKKIVAGDRVKDAFRCYRADRIKGLVTDLGTMDSLYCVPPIDAEGFTHW